MLQVKLVKSVIGSEPRVRKTVKALGLKKMNQVVYKEDQPHFRGMIHKVRHLVQVQETEGKPEKKSAPKKATAAKPKVTAAKKETAAKTAVKAEKKTTAAKKTTKKAEEK